MTTTTLKEYDYEIPEGLIAQEPLKKRDQARLLVIDRARKTITHDLFRNLNNYLPPKSLIVLNNSKVVPARLLGKKERSGGQVEIFLLKKTKDEYCYETLLRPLKKIKEGDMIIFDKERIRAEVIDRRKRIVRFSVKNISSFLERQGHMPLPPYIKRVDRKDDRSNYQTVYAKKKGSVASPTAGLHFTKSQLEGLKKEGHCVSQVTLHVNYGTFKPVEANDLTKHKMHIEEYEMTKRTLNAILNARKHGQKIVAVGTTSCRVLESVAASDRLRGKTNLFIYPGYQFKWVDMLITNFHLPLTTLLMLVYAFAGKQLMKKAYSEAIKLKYRFYSYGDAMLII